MSLDFVKRASDGEEEALEVYADSLLEAGVVADGARSDVLAAARKHAVQQVTDATVAEVRRNWEDFHRELLAKAGR